MCIPPVILQPIKAVLSVLRYLSKCTAGTFFSNCAHTSLNSATDEGCTKPQYQGKCIAVFFLCRNCVDLTQSMKTVHLFVRLEDHEVGGWLQSLSYTKLD